jgi:glycosyltransferase involved in cell wall biosynthesis
MSYPGKGIDLLLKATRKVLDHYKRDIKLLVIGGGLSDCRDYIDTQKRNICELGLDSNVIWTGSIATDEISGLLKLSSVVVLPFRSGASDRRGSLLAALSHNKAVVTTKPVLNISLFKNGENMIWPESDDAASFAKSMIQVLDNNELRQRLETGSAELAKHFCWSKITEQTRSFFIDLLQNNLNYQYKVH